MSNNSTKMRLFFSHLYYCVSASTLREKNIFPRLLFQWKEDEKLILRQPQDVKNGFKASYTEYRALWFNIENPKNDPKVEYKSYIWGLY